jgi:hypothetical protein
MGCISRPGVKHNPYATISVNRTTVAENGGLVLSGGASFQFDNSRGEYYTDRFTLSVNARANGEDLYYEIVGPGAVESRFWTSGRFTGYLAANASTHPDFSTATTTGNILKGRIGRLNTASWEKNVFGSPTTSNTNDTATTTTFSVNLRTRDATTGPLLSTSATVTCYRWRFVIDIYNESTGNYQNASYTGLGEFTTVGTTSRNYYARLLLPTNTIYNNQSIFGSPNWTIQVTAPSTGTAVTVNTDIASSMSWNGVWNDGPTYNYHWFGSATYKDNTTEPIEYFRLQLQYTSPTGISPGVPWTISQDHAIAANTA